MRRRFCPYGSIDTGYGHDYIESEAKPGAVYCRRCGDMVRLLVTHEVPRTVARRPTDAVSQRTIPATTEDPDRPRGTV